MKMKTAVRLKSPQSSTHQKSTDKPICRHSHSFLIFTSLKTTQKVILNINFEYFEDFQIYPYNNCVTLKACSILNYNHL